MATKTNEKVYAMVETELRKNPDVENSELYEKAKEVDKGIAKLTARQFNARYPLQVKRKMSTGNGGTTTKKKSAPKKETKAEATEAPAASTPTSESNDKVRAVLIQLVKDVANADNGEVVDLVLDMDSYVDKVMAAV